MRTSPAAAMLSRWLSDMMLPLAVSTSSPSAAAAAPPPTLPSDEALSSMCCSRIMVRMAWERLDCSLM